jgi:hypothetical protein
MYRQGEGVPKDYSQAMAWYRKAAKHGSAGAQIGLGFMYHLGQGVPKDYSQAYMWYNLGAAQGIGGMFRDDLEKLMTPDQIAEGQRLAREWVEQHQ